MLKTRLLHSLMFEWVQPRLNSLIIIGALGILDLDDKADDDPDDEILAELRKKQSELKAISQHNVTVTKKLYRLAKEMMDKQELRKKLAASDAEVS